MLKVVVFTNKYGKKSARLVADLGYRQVVLTWDTYLCAEILKIAVVDLLSKENCTIIVE